MILFWSFFNRIPQKCLSFIILSALECNILCRVFLVRTSKTFLNFYIPPMDGKCTVFRQFFDVVFRVVRVTLSNSSWAKTCFRSIIGSNLSISKWPDGRRRTKNSVIVTGQLLRENPLHESRTERCESIVALGNSIENHSNWRIELKESNKSFYARSVYFADVFARALYDDRDGWNCDRSHRRQVITVHWRPTSASICKPNFWYWNEPYGHSRNP